MTSRRLAARLSGYDDRCLERVVGRKVVCFSQWACHS